MLFLQLLGLVLGASIRVLFSGSGLAAWLSENSEINTPQTSWKRVSESFALLNHGISPYAGDVFHEMPLLMYLLKFAHQLLQSKLYLFFLACDVLTSYILGSIADSHGRYLLSRQAVKIKHYSLGTEELLLKTSNLKATKTYVILVYLLNPYTLATCLAKSTTSVHNLVLATALLFIFKGSRTGGCVFIALAAYLNLYPVMLIVPLAIYIAQKESQVTRPGQHPSPVWLSVTRTCLGVVVVLTALLYLSYLIDGRWRFLQATWGFILSVPDLNPNVGLFWYFFTEMFDHFFIFYLFVFQMNVFLYTAPLAIRYKEHPLLVAYTLVVLMAIFKSYPCYGDTALYLSLLPLWRHCYSFMRNTFVVCVMFVICSLLAPALYYLWIYAGSANSNFYFAVTLAYACAQIFLVSDLLYAFTRREFHLSHGLQPPDFEGKPGLVLLD